MYIFELIYSLIQKKREKKPVSKFDDEEETCNHIFVPVDSTKKVLACTKCGVIKKI